LHRWDEEAETMTAKEKVNILMVDDQPGKVMSYEAILAELDENLLKANSGREALEVLLKNEVAVVLMDVSMPEMDGFEMADIIHQHPRFQKSAIIFISAVHLTDVDQLRGYQRGAVDYISVPIIPELLRAKVRTFIDLYRKSQQLESLNVELRRLSMSLITTQDEERRRIARELHDGLGQELTAAKIMLQEILQQEDSKGSGESIRDVSGMIDGMLQQIRNISYLLHPPLLDEIGLRSALGWFLDGLSKRGGIQTSLETQPAEFPRLAPEVETALFRIIQEALTNVFRHARAQKVWVILAERKKEIAVTVRDDGVGVMEHTAQFRPGNTGVGIASMRQRAKELGGEMKIRNANPGTVVELVIPIPSATSSTPGPRAQTLAHWS
jgi:signal transduction histidine kinase